jgi:UDP-N-acetylmuramate--alanine ligase
VNQSAPVFDFADMRVHMVGIGGAGMSAAAAMLLKFGANLSGSDLEDFDGLGALVNTGARIAVGHREEQLHPDTELVVISAAIPDSNPELAAARVRRLPVIKYAELLGALMRHHRGVAIAGTHGKSTTTAMCAHLFREAGLAPSFVIGARSDQLGGNSDVGSGPHLIVESCEFDRSFLHFEPASAAILNIEPDHLDCYGSFEEIVEAFAQFAEGVAPDGLLVCNAEDRWARKAAEAARARVETLGFEADADYRALNLTSDRGRYAFEVTRHGRHVLSTQLSVPGRYNVSNALAAIALTCDAGGDPDSIARALSTFAGIQRRLTWRGEGRGVIVVDDYAHHPTEVRVTIEAARYRYQPKRTWVVFQPHQYSRTRHFIDQFADSFGDVDEVVVPDVYGARESNTSDQPMGSEELVSRIRKNGGRARYVPTLDAVAEHVAMHVVEGDLVVTMGAGDVWKVADELVERICRPDRAGRSDRADDVVLPGRTSAVPVPAV